MYKHILKLTFAFGDHIVERMHLNLTSDDKEETFIPEFAYFRNKTSWHTANLSDFIFTGRVKSLVLKLKRVERTTSAKSKSLSFIPCTRMVKPTSVEEMLFSKLQTEAK